MDCGLALSLTRVIRSKSSQGLDAPWHSFAEVFMRIWAALFTLPEACGLCAMCRGYWPCKSLNTCWVTWEVKEGALSLWREWSNPKGERFPLGGLWSPLWPIQFLWGGLLPIWWQYLWKQSYLYPLQGGTWVKSSCQFSLGYVPHLWIGWVRGGSLVPWQLL